MAGNFVPPTQSSTLGTSGNRWAGGFFDRLAVKAIEVIGGGGEDTQPATVGWVQQSFSKMLRTALAVAGLRTEFGVNGYICFGKIFDGATIQWGIVTGKVLNDFSYIEIRYPISFDREPTTIASVAENSANGNAGFIVAEAGVDVNKTSFVIRSNGQTSDDFRLRWLSFGFC